MPPGSSTWNIDHPTGMTLQLGDGAWHHVLSQRILEYAELRGFGPTPQTGLYLEEVISSGEPKRALSALSWRASFSSSRI